jgi:hypothetical protein
MGAEGRRNQAATTVYYHNCNIVILFGNEHGGLGFLRGVGGHSKVRPGLLKGRSRTTLSGESARGWEACNRRASLQPKESRAERRSQETLKAPKTAQTASGAPQYTCDDAGTFMEEERSDDRKVR